MKTFTATHLNKHAQEVFAAVDKDGWVTIRHDRYPENDIILMKRARPDGTFPNWEPHPVMAIGDTFYLNSEECVVVQANGDKDGE